MPKNPEPLKGSVRNPDGPARLLGEEEVEALVAEDRRRHENDEEEEE